MMCNCQMCAKKGYGWSFQNLKIISNFLEGKEICVLWGLDADKYSKCELECLVRAHGGELTQMPSK